MNIESTQKAPSNQDVVTAKLITQIKKNGMLFVLEDLEQVLTELLVAQARDHLRVPVNAPVSKSAAARARLQLWEELSYGNTNSSTSVGVNLQSQLRIVALRKLSDDAAFTTALKSDVQENLSNLSPVETVL